VRVRLIHLQGLAALLTLGWAATSIAVVASYHPGGPFDIVVATAPIVATIASAGAGLWPPIARGDRAAAAMSWLGIAALLLLVPSLIDLVVSTKRESSSILFPSPEAAYAWVLALVATSIFAGLGVARRLLGATAMRAPRLVLGLVVAVAISAVGGGISAAALLANDRALRDVAPEETDWGPAGGSVTPPGCSALLIAGSGARITVGASATADGSETGTVTLAGTRAGQDESWHADLGGIADAALRGGSVAGVGPSRTPAEPSRSGTGDTGVGPGASPAAGSVTASPPLAAQGVDYTRVGDRAWIRSSAGAAWQRATTGTGAPPPPTLDQAIVQAALPDRARLAAEDVGIDLFDGARARHCRLAVDGPTALAAFPSLRWLVGRNPLDTSTVLEDWRGTLDWWVFGDHELGVAEVTVGGFLLGEVPAGGIQGTLTARLTARDRVAHRPIVPPAP
jgi:hypothetical protein